MDPASALDELVKLVPPPNDPDDARRPDHPDWDDVVLRTGLEFPGDYRQIIFRYGTFSWADFLTVLNPFSRNINLRMETKARLILDGELSSRRDNPRAKQFAFWPEGGGLYPWAVTSNGDSLFWKTLGPASWWPTFVIPARDVEAAECLPLTATGVIYNFLLGTLASRTLSDPFEGKSPLDSWRSTL